MSEKRKKSSDYGVFTIPVFWGVIFFVIGLFVYGNFDSALMLGIFGFPSAFISLLFLIPFAGIILWISATFFWDWKGVTARALGLNPSDTVVLWCWYVPTIIYLVIGIIFSIFLIIFLKAMFIDK